MFSEQIPLILGPKGRFYTSQSSETITRSLYEMYPCSCVNAAPVCLSAVVVLVIVSLYEMLLLLLSSTSHKVPHAPSRSKNEGMIFFPPNNTFCMLHVSDPLPPPNHWFVISCIGCVRWYCVLVYVLCDLEKQVVLCV